MITLAEQRNHNLTSKWIYEGPPDKMSKVDSLRLKSVKTFSFICFTLIPKTFYHDCNIKLYGAYTSITKVFVSRIGSRAKLPTKNDIHRTDTENVCFNHFLDVIVPLVLMAFSLEEER